MAPVRRVEVAGTHVEVEELGAGEPLVVVQTALSVDEHAPLARALGADLHVWHVRRPGYGSCGPARTPGSIAADADLVALVVERLDVGRAHLVGASYSAAVVVTLATRHPGLARSLTLVEPPPTGTPGAGDFRAANERLLAVAAGGGPGRALDEVMRIIDGPDWRANTERELPGSVASMERDAATFVDADVPALLTWRLDDAEAAAVECPTLLVGGSASGAWFAEMLTRLERLLPATTRVTIAGAGHSAALTHAADVGAAIRDHVRSVSSGGSGTRPAGGRS